MSSSPSPLLKVELQASGENPDSWGDKANATFTMLENAIAKTTTVSTTGGTTTLTDTQYADSQARAASLDFAGVLVSNAIIIVPPRSKYWVVRNGCTGAFTLTIKTAAGTGVIVNQGQVGIVWSDGANVTSVLSDATTVNGIAAASFARRDVANAFAAGNAYTFHAVADGATLAIDANIGKNFSTTLGGNRTITLTNPVDGSEVVYYLTQDVTGGRTVTWPSNVLNPTSVTLSTAANATDRVTLVYRGDISQWYPRIDRALTAGGSSTIADITIVGGNVDVDAYALAGSPAGAVTFAFTVETGAYVQASSPGSPALDFSGFAVGSVISIVNRGYILGRGGRGGRGAFAGDINSADIFGDGTAGSPGGTAMRLPSTACAITINNATGQIWGGGGGGGGGAVTHNGDGTNVGVAGGGGGGGNGGGIGGDGGSIVAANGAPGVAGGIGRTGAAGTGGTGISTGGTGSFNSGGTGGDYGASGTTPAALTTNTFDGAPGAGAAAGKAIDYNGGSAPTYTAGSTGSPRIKGLTS